MSDCRIGRSCPVTVALLGVNILPDRCQGLTNCQGRWQAFGLLRSGPVQDMPLQDMPLQDMPLQDMPLQDMPLQDMPLQDMPLQDMPLQDMPLQDMPLQDMPIRDMPLLDMPPRRQPPDGQKAPCSKLVHPFVVFRRVVVSRSRYDIVTKFFCRRRFESDQEKGQFDKRFLIYSYEQKQLPLHNAEDILWVLYRSPLITQP